MNGFRIFCTVRTSIAANEARKRFQAKACPGLDPGACPGLDPGACPGLDPGACPGLDPGACPGLDPGACPGLDPGVETGWRQENASNQDLEPGFASIETEKAPEIASGRYVCASGRKVQIR